MSVLIKGMEMPASCYECRFFVDTWCYAFKADDWRNAYNKPPKGERLNNCPLVPVPPHGRLIDGDVAEVIHFTEEDADGKDFYDGILYAADFISQQPTIIPSEEE